MKRIDIGAVGGISVLGFSMLVTACGAGSSSSKTSTPAPTSYIGTNGVFVAAADPASESQVLLIDGAAGKRQFLRGTVDLMTGKDIGQAAGIEMYEGADGHIHAINMSVVGTPAATQISSEAGATTDDVCTSSGSALAGANSDYVGVYAVPDYMAPVNYSYFYRLPGPDGVCNTTDDVIHLVHPNTGAGVSPLVAAAMPAATTYDPGTGAISNFIAKMGPSIVALDHSGAWQSTLATYGSPIQVLSALPNSYANGLPAGGLFVVDGDIVHVNYGNGAVSSSLFTIPNWTPRLTLSAAASPTTLYFSIFTPATNASPASSTIYALPLDGSAAATAVDFEAGDAFDLTYPAQSNQLLFAVTNSVPSFSVKAISMASGAVNTLVTINQNSGRFVATASTVYYTSTQATASNATTLIRSGILSGIVGTDGTVIASPITNSEFMTGGQQTPAPSGVPLWAPEPIAAVLRIRNLTPASTVTAVNLAGVTITAPALSGGLIEAIDTTTNQVVATIGNMPTSAATYLTDTFRVLNNVGYIDATNDASTENPKTRDLYLIDTRAFGSLKRITNNL